MTCGLPSGASHKRSMLSIGCRKPSKHAVMPSQVPPAPPDGSFASTPAELCRCWHHGHSLRTLGAHALLYGCLAAGQLRCQLCAKVVPDHKILAQHLKDKHDRESADDSAAQTPEPNLTFSLADLLRTQRCAACIPPHISCSLLVQREGQ